MTDSEKLKAEPYQRINAAGAPCKVCGAPSMSVGYCKKCYGKERQRRKKAGLSTKMKAANTNRICSVDGCDRAAVSGGMCPAHWQRHTRGQCLVAPIEGRAKVPDEPCTAPGCENPQYCKSLCERHYNRLITTGKLETTRLWSRDEWDRTAVRCFRKIQSDVRKTRKSRWEIWIMRKVQNIRNRGKNSKFYLEGHVPKKRRKRQVANWRRWIKTAQRKLSNERGKVNRDKWDRWAERTSYRQNQRIANR